MPASFLSSHESAALVTWFEAHPDGYCVELLSGGRDPVLHRVGCPHLGAQGIDWSPIPVVCYDGEDDLVAWEREYDQLGLSSDYVNRLQDCDVCRPDHFFERIPCSPTPTTSSPASRPSRPPSARC